MIADKKIVNQPDFWDHIDRELAKYRRHGSSAFWASLGPTLQQDRRLYQGQFEDMDEDDEEGRGEEQEQTKTQDQGHDHQHPPAQAEA